MKTRWLYLFASYPALITLPYFIGGDAYASWTRAAYVLLTASLALALMQFVIAPALAGWRARLEKNVTALMTATVLLAGSAAFYLAYFVRLRNGLGIVEDVAHIEQVLWAGSQGHLFYSSLSTGIYAHFGPILIPLTLIYALVPDIGAVYAVQSFLLAAAALPLYLLARDATDRLSALFIGLAFLFSPAVFSQHFTLYLNHFAPFFWLGAALAFWRRKLAAFIVFSLLAASVLEDIAPALLIFALFAWREKRALSWKLAATLFPLLWIAIAFLFIQARGSVTGWAFGSHFVQLGRTPAEILQTVLSNPQIILSYFLANAPNKMLWVYELLTPFLIVLPFLSLMSLAALPDWLAFNFTPLGAEQYSVVWYYSLLITTVLFTSLVYGLNKIRGWTASAAWGSKAAPVITALVLCSNLATLPIGISPEIFRSDGGRRMATLYKIRSLIPADACVTTTYDVTQPFAQRNQLYGLYDDSARIPYDCQYVVISLPLIALRPAGTPFQKLVHELQSGNTYRLILEENQIQLLQRE